MTTPVTTYTVHHVLAAAYVTERSLLIHASINDDAGPSLCRKAKNLCDVGGNQPGDEVTCPECLKRIAKRGLTRAE